MSRGEIIVVQFDIQGHSKINVPPGHLQKARQMLERHISAVTGIYGSNPIKWSGDGGWCWFSAQDSANFSAATDAAIAVLQILPWINQMLLRDQVLEESLVVRISADAVSVALDDDPCHFCSDGMSAFLKYEREIGRGNCVILTKRIMHHLPLTYRPRFSEVGFCEPVQAMLYQYLSQPLLPATEQMRPTPPSPSSAPVHTTATAADHVTPDIIIEPIIATVNSKSHFEGVLAVCTFIMMLFSAIPAMYLLMHKPELATILFSFENLGVILVLSAQIALLYKEKHLYAQRLANVQLVFNNERDQYRTEQASGRRKAANALTVLFEEFHHMNHIRRDLMNSSEYPARNLSVNDTVDTLIKYCDSLKEVFRTLFAEQGLSFRICIKAICSGGSDPHVITIARDRHMSTTDNHTVDNSAEQRLLANADFKILLKKDVVVFACDDLLALAAAGLFQNSSSGWKERYTATMIVPIRKNAVVRPGEIFELVGYICVDCKPPKGSKIFCDDDSSPRRDLRNLMLAYADSTFSIVKRGKIVDAETSSVVGGDYVLDETNFEFVRMLNERFAAM